MAEARVYMRIPVLSRFGDRCLFLQYLARQEARSESICSEITTKLQWRSRLAGLRLPHQARGGKSVKFVFVQRDALDRLNSRQAHPPVNVLHDISWPSQLDLQLPSVLNKEIHQRSRDRR